MYRQFEPHTTGSRGLVISVLAYETRGPGWNRRVGRVFQSVFSSSLFSILMMNYFIQKGHYQNDRNGQSLTFYIELCMKSMGVG